MTQIRELSGVDPFSACLMNLAGIWLDWCLPGRVGFDICI